MHQRLRIDSVELTGSDQTFVPVWSTGELSVNIQSIFHKRISIVMETAYFGYFDRWN